MSSDENAKAKAVEREAKRLERLSRLRLVEQPRPVRVAAPPSFEPPKDAA